MLKGLALLLGLSGIAVAQAQPQGPQQPQQPQQPVPAQAPGGFKQRDNTPVAPGTYRIEPGTHILLSMINSVSSKQAQVGDRIYLETAFPIMAANHIVIPQGSWVTGTITDVKAAKRGRKRGEMQVRFDSLTLPNGITRNFNSDLGSVDARDPLKHEHDKVTSSEGKGGAAETVATTTAAGAGIGSAIGVGTGHVLRGVGVGAGAGAAAGLVGVLVAHGPEANLSKGATVEMVLDRPLTFQESELDFSHVPPPAALSEGGSRTSDTRRRTPIPGIPW